MARVFISHVMEDEAVAREIADGLEQAGCATWYFERDCYPGPSYLEQITTAIEEGCDVVVVLISERSILSRQATNEVVHAFECGVPFVPLLLGIRHEQLQSLKPELRHSLGAHASVQVPPAGVAAILPRIVNGLKWLRTHSGSAVGNAADPEVVPAEAGQPWTSSVISEQLASGDGRSAGRVSADRGVAQSDRWQQVQTSSHRPEFVEVFRGGVVIGTPKRVSGFCEPGWWDDRINAACGRNQTA